MQRIIRIEEQDTTSTRGEKTALRILYDCILRTSTFCLTSRQLQVHAFFMSVK